jgi:ADP-ribose pyrophosphatase YjhB (NUDIX family)
MTRARLPDIPRPLCTVDLAIFSIRDHGLHVLLVSRPTSAAEPFPSRWALPGGFLDMEVDVDLEACALRKLEEKTGVSAPYLEQVGSWGSALRDPRGWSVTHLYFALISSEDLQLAAGGNAADARWFEIRDGRTSEKLAFDHDDLLGAAVRRLRNKVEYTSLPAFLMPEEFTLSELQVVYEIALGRPLEKKAFRTRVLAADLLKQVPRRRAGANRPAQLYKLKHSRKPVFFARALSSGTR